MKRGVTIEFVSDIRVTNHIGDGWAVAEHWGRPVIMIGKANVPLSNLGGDKIGLIMSYKMEDGYIKFEAMVRDTPQMREDIGIEGIAGPTITKIAGGHAKIMRQRPHP